MASRPTQALGVPGNFTDALTAQAINQGMIDAALELVPERQVSFHTKRVCDDLQSMQMRVWHHIRRTCCAGPGVS
jgi:hypothetical protein